MKIVVLEGDEAIAYLDELANRVSETVLEKIEKRLNNLPDKSEKNDEIWCGTEKAKEILGVERSKMQKLRDNSPENGIQISREGRTIRYYVPSLYQYIQNHIVRG